MKALTSKKYFFFSLSVHISIFLVLVLGFDFTSPLAVIENTNKTDVISAVVLGDTAKSKILLQQPSTPPVAQKPEEKKVEPQAVPPAKTEPDKDVIALKAIEKKKADQKALAEKMRKQLMPKDLLADIKKQKDKQKLKQKQLQSQFQKRLREQSEKSLRQQLLNEEIKLQGVQSRQAQGEVNKYKALIMQAISEHWMIPLQANKKLYTVLMIRIAPGGMVLDVQVTKSSGDPSLDSSARAAVLKSSPLPVPSDTAAFEAFRQFVLKMKPENVISNDLT